MTIALGIALLGWLNNPHVPNLVPMAADTTDPMTWLINLGTAGVWLVCMMTGLLRTKGEVDRLIEEGKAKDRAIETLVSLMTTRTLPTLATAVAEMPTAASAAAQRESALEKQLAEALRRVEKVLGDERPS